MEWINYHHLLYFWTVVHNLRRGLDQWFDSQQIRPIVVGQFEDFALLRRFGETGAGAALTAIEDRLLEVRSDGGADHQELVELEDAKRTIRYLGKFEQET